MVNLNVLGIDIGSVAVCIAEADFHKNIVNYSYVFHKGDVAAILKEQLNSYDFSRISHIAVTSSTPDIIKYDAKFNNQVAIICAAKQLHGDFKAILSVGGEKFGLLSFDEKGRYQNFKSNTSCAAGTGSFLDQQAGRLNLENIASLSSIAHSNKKGFPKIASRCAVFAKTDLIHAQQEGYSLGEISEGLCAGLAKNIVDTLFNETTTRDKIIFCGGVSKNNAVKEHLASMTGADIVVDELSHLYGAVGAAFCLMDELADELGGESGGKSAITADIFLEKKTGKKLFYPRLELTRSEYPDFNSLQKYNYYSQQADNKNFVEVDVYEDLADKKKLNVRIGVDIGSTSTKAVLLGEENAVLAGFYTRTAGAPLTAMCLILESMHDLVLKNHIDLIVNGCGTTGSGRKFIGKIIGADIIVDEITAHARAACEINSAVDTIIEIGGQDAKFTTLKNGMVTSSTMNNVCAAGTGSFIEEQASKLGCAISDYSARTENVKAPMSSDRCTVFMERDLNHYLTEGYAVNEVLASVLHSVRENYLLKVATQSNIGDVVFFQGATAKNRALVAAFEQRLKKPILVSKFCHLTGALGTALTLKDENVNNTIFRGIDIYKKEIPVISEVCDICNNSCKISVAQINGEKVAYGFLCGRDYDTQQYVNNKISGFDLLKERKKIEFSPVSPNGQAFAKAQNGAKIEKNDFTIGIPAALHLFEDIAFWKYFFDSLGVKTVFSSNYKGAVKRGKNLSETEFCAPATAMYGHVEYLMGKSDFIFLPYYLENKSKTGRRQYCYYTQYVPTIMAKYNRKKILRPLVKYLYTNFYTKIELYKMLKSIEADISFFDISSAYDKAWDFKQSCEEKFKTAYTKEIENSNDVSVVFLGRPYTILSPEMNSGIPGIFSSLGIKTFYQDMVPLNKDGKEETDTIAPLLADIHWNYPAAILKAAEKIAKTPNVYPVFITSFKCTPDSFGLKYFKELMDKHEKPYLILELDEHDSSVGYETRIEAAIRSFRNNSFSLRNQQGIKKEKKEIDYSSLFLNPARNIKGKNLVFPNWDNTSCRLLVATLKGEGINAYLIEETGATIQKSMKFNTGQCIPVNAIAQGFVETIEKNNLDPANTLLWLSKANFCNLKLYPNFIKSLLTSYGNNMDQAGIFIGELTFIDISIRASMNAFFSHMFGGMLTKMGCRTRPYEIEKGTTDQVIEKSITILEDAFLGNRSKEEAVAQIVSRFEWIEVDKRSPRPKVAIFGDLYVRDNDTMNQNLIAYIEENGGEVITTPYTDMGKMIAPMYYKKWFNEGLYASIMKVKTIVKTMGILERKYYKYFERVLKEPQHVYDEPPEKILSQYNIINENIGESMENTLKIHYLTKHHPDLTLFIQTNPAFCCPSLVTEAMKKEIEKITSVPIVSITYDGTGGMKNESVVPYLKFPRKLDKRRFGESKEGKVSEERKETEFTLICL